MPNFISLGRQSIGSRCLAGLILRFDRPDRYICCGGLVAVSDDELIEEPEVTGRSAELEVVIDIGNALVKMAQTGDVEQDCSGDGDNE